MTTLRRSGLRSVATLVTVSLLVAACADDDAGDSVETGSEAPASEPTGSDGSETGSSPADTATSATEATVTESSGSSPSTGGDGSESSGVRTSQDDGEPVPGGTLIYALEADTANGWAPYRSSLATSGYIPLSSVTDSLFSVDAEGEVVGNLVESVEHDEDHSRWTMRLREGITFQDGSPFDAEAVKFNMDSCIHSALTGAALTTIESVEASGLEVAVNVRGGSWVAFPSYFVSGCGYQMSAEWLKTLADIPQRNPESAVFDEELAATPADGDPASPVGLGAFTFESYTPGNGNSFRAVRNEDYWRGPNGITGEELPYLDAIEAVVAVDEEGRGNGLRSGQFDVMMTANADTISGFIDDGEFDVDSSTLYGDTNYAMLNVAEGELDPAGENADSPLLNVDCRRALAHAIDRERYVEERGAGLIPPANGPFPPGSLGHLEDSGYPEFDLDMAQQMMDSCLEALGTDSIEFSYNTTNDPFNVESNTLILSMWNEAFGDAVNATISPAEQGQYIGLALVGSFDALGWRSHSGVDPDTQRLWWQSTSAQPIGGLALNFGRFQDADMDAQMEIIKSDPDPEARRAATEEVNRIFGDQVYNLWLSWTLWGIVSDPSVNGVQANTLPDGGEGIGLAGAGRHLTNQMWCTDGDCG
ncbi:ABC transporter substrate-binding protein [Ilumatobacter sp.]|uniref:ABC transporter substrate-binding protein n=1 Tax=Ilumatobacter sp. TaxID=1967498 RepID=UPI003B51F37F